jgi:type I restriction enzyme, S subunit
MKKYDSYKDSGIEWIGDASAGSARGIPEHWEVKKIKYVTTINDDVLSEKTAEDFEIDYVDISSIDSNVGIARTETLMFKEAPSRARRLVKNGDIIVSTVRTYLKAIAKIIDPKPNLVVSTGFAVIRPRQIVSDFTGYLFFHENLLGEIISRSVGVSYPAINSSEIGTIKIPLPPPSEQTAIAAYLDRKTAEIDELIADKKRLLELYDEEKTAIINELVTGKKVWNGYAWTEPVEVKVSGIEWLDDASTGSTRGIPEHWEVKRLKNIAKVQTGRTPKIQYSQSNYSAKSRSSCNLPPFSIIFRVCVRKFLYPNAIVFLPFR